MMSASKATVTVAAAVPNNRTLVKTNVSDTEIFAGMPGTLTAKKKLSSVSPVKSIHSFGMGSL